jgi:excisionase family DNA binding protein
MGTGFGPGEGMCAMTVDRLAVEGSTVERAGADRPGPGAAGTGGEAGGPFLTVAEVARRMRVSKMTVYRLVHSGELPANRFGRTFRVQRGAVEALIEAAR